MSPENNQTSKRLPASAPTGGQKQTEGQLQAARGTPTPASVVQPKAGAAPKQPFTEKEINTATAKYKALYDYSTDVLLKEHERFNRADDKASKYSTLFVFLIGVFAYFEKWSFEHVIKRPDSFIDYPTEWPVMVVATIGLIVSGIGWFWANRVIRLRPYASRPLNKEVLGFYDKHTLLDIYDSFARRNIAAYEENTKSTNKKYTILTSTHRLMGQGLTCLAVLLVLYALYSLV